MELSDTTVFPFSSGFAHLGTGGRTMHTQGVTKTGLQDLSDTR